MRFIWSLISIGTQDRILRFLLIGITVKSYFKKRGQKRFNFSII